MKKSKKIIPFFVILISAIFFKTGNVFAYKEITSNDITTYYLGNSYTDNAFNFDSLLNFVTEWTSPNFQINNCNPTNNQKYYYNSILNYIKNGDYLNYGKYYIAIANGTANARYIFITDYPEQIKITGFTGNGFIFTAYYDENKPVYLYKPYYNQISYINSNTFLTSVGYFDYNYIYKQNSSSSYPYGFGNFWSNIPEIYISDNIKFKVSDYTFETSSVLFYGSDTGILSVEPLKPALKYKTGFISSESFDVLGKVSVEFNENDTNIYKYNNAQFKLQYGSNDFTKENIPVFSHIKIYGKYTDNDSSTWQEVDVNSINVANEKMGIQITDTTYDYVEGALADSTITFQMDFMKNINSLYENWKIEFYFDNTENSYIYCFDTLEESKWEDTPKFLENYIFYEFPSNYMYAYISSDSEENSGRVYFPTNSIENSEVLLKGKYYNISSKEFDSFLNSYIYESDSYYSYIDFKCNTSEKIFTLNRYKGTVEHYRNLYGPDFLSFVEVTFNAGNIQQAYLAYAESTYFYAPVGYNVVFSNGKDDISVNTGNGFIDISVGDTTDMTNSSSYATNENILLTFIQKTWNNFISPFKVFSQLKGIIDNIYFDSNNDEVPHFKVDFSFFGVEEELDIIDFTWYLQYRDTVFNFIYLSIGGITIFKVISALRRVFGGGD